MKTKLLSLFVALIATSALWASNVITYTTTSQLCDYNGSLSVGKTTFGPAITSHTFSNGTGTITCSGEITTIGNSAFRYCDRLTSITIPNSVTTIGDWAFYGCTNLATVFNGSELNITKGSSDFGYVAYYAKNVYNGIPKGDFVIKNDILLVKYIGNDARVTIPNSVTTIGSSAFSGCSGLTSVTIPNSVTTIGEYAFYDCSGLTKTNYTGTIADWCKIKFGGPSANPMCYSYNFYINDVEVKDLVIPEGVDTIGDYAFYHCSSLTSVTLPNSVITIGDYAFYHCSSLTSVTLPNSVITIGDLAFRYCSGLTSVSIPNSVTTIGGYAFNGCSGLVDIYCYATIPPSCEYASDFDGVSEHCYIHVLTGTKRAYELAVGWSHFIHFFEISEISGETTGEVGVEVTANTAIFSWPVNPTASSYTFVIKKNDEVFCTLTFNSLGQLVGMAFAPARNRNQQSSATVYGYSFVVSNLDASSTYDYIFTAKDNTDQILSTQSGSFTTEEVVTDLFSVPYHEKEGLETVKFIRDGQLLILRNGSLFNARGARVK